MGNHCIDVVCAGCGRCWCLRGCNSDDKPNPMLAKRAQRRHARKPGYVWNETCCKGYPVLSDSIIMGEDPEEMLDDLTKEIADGREKETSA